MGGYGIGETTVEYWQDKRSEDGQIMCYGGRMWAGRWRLHEVILVQTKLTFWQRCFSCSLLDKMFLYAGDYTGAIDNFNESQFWTSAQWVIVKTETYEHVMGGICL